MQSVNNALNQQKTVSTLQGLKIKEFLTLKLIDAVVLECECLTSAQHIFSTFPTWEKKHAEVIMQVINDLCKEC